MMILLFDMDGVLLQPNGYHRALQDTVRRVSASLGFSGVELTAEHIARFEAHAITSEWLSSALCLAVMVMEKLRQNQHPQISDILPTTTEPRTPFDLQLEELFTALADQPATRPALTRAAEALKILAERMGVPSQLPVSIVLDSEKIEESPTLNIFQELVLGSQTFQKIYNKPPQMEQTSYLTLFDKPLLSSQHRQQLAGWLQHTGHSAAIMTNRPSNSLLGLPATPEAENGAALVGLQKLPLVGFGELVWLSGRINRPVGELIKPNPEHALAAMLAAGGVPLTQSLTLAGKNDHDPTFDHLHSSTVVVFEDSPGGFLAAEQAVALLMERGIGLDLIKIGVSENESKRAALAAHGASVYPSVNQGLDSLGLY